MPIIYDGHQLIPAPLVTIDKQYYRTQGQTKVGKTFNISIKGKIVATKGSPWDGDLPSPTGTYDIDGNLIGTGTVQADGFWEGGINYPGDQIVLAPDRQDSIQFKQEKIRWLFSTDGRLLEIMPWDGQPPMKCRPIVKNIQFSEGLWFDVCDYTITLEAPELYGHPFLNGGDEDNPDRNPSETLSFYISQASEAWSIEMDTEHFGAFRASHTVSATGKLFFDKVTGLASKQPWQRAQDYVISKLGFDTNVGNASGVFNIVGRNPYNHVRTENLNEIEGSFAVTENWVLATGTFLETFTVESKNTAQDGLTSVTLQGTINGLDTTTHLGSGNFPDTFDKFTNAETHFDQVRDDMLGRAQQYANVILNIRPLTQIVTRNPLQGIITYNFEYNNRPSNCFSGTVSEVVSITDTNPKGYIQEHAEVFVVNRGSGFGPVLQDLGASAARKRSINIEVVLSGTNPIPSICLNPLAPASLASDVETLIQNAAPTGFQVFVTDDTQNWVPTSRRYSRTFGWVYEQN